jgi:tetratricopeptide (TPR) repeat protein
MSLTKNIILFVIILSSVIFINNSIPAFAYNSQSVQFYNEGVDLSKNGNFQEAISMFKKALVIDPMFIDAYYNLASIYEYLGDEKEALTYFEIVLAKTPNDAQTAYKVASAYYKKKDYQKALGYLRNVPLNNPNHPEIQELYNQLVHESQKAASNQTTKPQAVDLSRDSIPNSMVLKDLQGPTGLATDSYGNLYVANYSANTIVKISPDGKRDIIAKNDLLNGPIGIVVDAADNIYVANYLSNKVIKITPQGQTSVILKGVNKPYYLYIDKTGILYISEQGTNTVIKIKVI